MNILLLCSTFYPVVGGAESYAYYLAQGLERAGHRVLVITDDVPSDLRALIRPISVRVERCNQYRSELDRPDRVRWEQMYFSLLGDVENLLRKTNFTPDLIHANSFECEIIAAVLAAERRIPFVLTAHEVDVKRFVAGGGRGRLAYNTLAPDAIIAGSEYYYEQALSLGAVPDRVHLVYHGVPLGLFRESDINRRKNLTLLCLARIKPRKGLLDLIRAVHLLLAENPEGWKLILCGSINSASSEYLEALRREVSALGLDRQVMIQLDRTLLDVPDLLASADMLVMPSLTEGLGLALLEAGAAGVPIVATQVAGITEIITDQVNGMLARPSDPHDLAAKIRQVARDSAMRKRIIRQGRDTVTLKFSLDVMIAGVERIYRGVM